MYRLQIEANFDAAHFLAKYKGKCRNIHGHRWRVLLSIKSEHLQSDEQNNGMIVDFTKLKNDLKKETEIFDHSLIIESDTLKESTMEALLVENFRVVTVKFRPTAENFAKYFYEKMILQGYSVDKVTVYETPTNCAEYYEDNSFKK